MNHSDRFIYHITTRTEWVQAQLAQVYMADSLQMEGFIHSSTKEQLQETANAFFKGRKDLVILCIETERVQAEIRYERTEGDPRFFPHIYGPLNLKAITKVLDFPPEADGSFRLPRELK
jgi:uncharacterized protein (DUF952 family)